MMAVRRLAACALVVMGYTSVVLPPPVTSLARLSASANSQTQTLRGAVFTPLSLDAPTVTVDNGLPRLSWGEVTISSGYPVSYSLVRTSTDATSSTTCPAASQIPVTGGRYQCDDTAAHGGATYSYTVQPFILRNGVTTWTRPVSGASTQVSIPRMKYGGVGPPAAFSGSSATVVSYPAGTTQGDILLVIARNARNKTISPPTGWTALVSQTNGSPASAFLVAWRVADAASSTTFSINSSNDGAVAWIVRYSRTPGVTATPVVATATPVWGESTTTTSSFSLATPMTTNQPYATALTIASTITGTVPSLSSGSGYESRVGTTASASANSFTLTLADLLSVTTNSQVSSPTWSSAISTNTWQAVTIAFA